jgi:hypothetical protein
MACGHCGVEFLVPQLFAKECRELGTKKTWHCPNGHGRVFDQTESDKLKKLLSARDKELSDLQARSELSILDLQKKLAAAKKSRRKR